MSSRSSFRALPKTGIDLPEVSTTAFTRESVAARFRVDQNLVQVTRRWRGKERNGEADRSFSPGMPPLSFRPSVARFATVGSDSPRRSRETKSTRSPAPQREARTRMPQQKFLDQHE